MQQLQEWLVGKVIGMEHMQKCAEIENDAILIINILAEPVVDNAL